MKSKKFLFIIISVFVSVVLSEFTLRTMGFDPGVFKPYDGFKHVDDLVLYHIYELDDRGIYKLNTDYISALYDSILTNPSEPPEETYLIHQEDIKNVYDSFRLLNTHLHNEIDSQNLFQKGVITTLDSVDGSDSLYKALLLAYLNEPFNKEGFRSLPFKQAGNKRVKVLLLGDSFVYGMSADPFYKSFSDLLLAKGYAVYNTGINGTDPAQYSAVAEKYIPLLNPDIVVLNFSSASDFMLFDRDPAEGKPHEHFTNAGFLLSDPLGEYMDAEEVYQFYIDMVSVPDGGLFNKISEKFVVTSLLWGALNSVGITEHKLYDEYQDIRNTTTRKQKALNTKKYVDKIQKVCNENEVPLFNAIIPLKPQLISLDVDYNDYFIDEAHLNIVFGSGNYQYPKNFNIDDYEEYGDHFNNSGSKKFALFLDKKIKETLNIE